MSAQGAKEGEELEKANLCHPSRVFVQVRATVGGHQHYQDSAVDFGTFDGFFEVGLVKGPFDGLLFKSRFDVKAFKNLNS